MTIHETNMNLGVPQCKNCWKWEHLTLSCCSHISRYAKCYGAHNTKHHREKAWCCMENKKVNRVATKVGEPCLHVFKCINCKGDHQCYNLKLKVSSNKTTLVLSNTRELDRVPSIK